MMPASASSQAADALSAVENAAAGVPADDAQEIVSRDSVFSEAPESEELHPLGTDSTKEKVAELNKIEPIGADVDTAIDAHNTIRSLDGYKNAALEYKEAVARHERAVEALRNRITPLSRISAGVIPTRKLSGQAVSWAKMLPAMNCAEVSPAGPLMPLKPPKPHMLRQRRLTILPIR